MKTKNRITLTQARKSIFSIADNVQKPNTHYTLTERGVARAVIISANRFEKMVKGNGAMMLADGSFDNFSHFPKFPGTLIIRDESRVVYLSQKDQEQKVKEENLIKAQLYIELIEKLAYPLELVELGRYVRIGGKESRRYIEADVIINDYNGNVDAIFEVSCFNDYEENMDIVVEDLFELADSLSWVKKPKYLIYYSRKSRKGDVEEKISAIDCSKFNTFSAWKKAGRPALPEIPQYAQ